MVKMSHSPRKKAGVSKGKVKVRGNLSDANIKGSSNGEREKNQEILGNASSRHKSKNGEAKIADLASIDATSSGDWIGYHQIGLKKEPVGGNQNQNSCSNNNSYGNGKHEFREQSSPLSFNERAGYGETGQDETSSNGNKDEEDDDDDESEDKMDTQQHDPERLKAFNMFVRLFVDENLDRMVPISKQPKEKIQAIIDSCTRQFPEFAERARKRIRTYLKSCRRNKRSRDSNGWESTRPTPAHLTSVQAEQILAQACENESQNAKRMRMGLEPVGQPLPTTASTNETSKTTSSYNDSSGGDRDNGVRHSARERNVIRDDSDRGNSICEKEKTIVKPIPVSSSTSTQPPPPHQPVAPIPSSSFPHNLISVSPKPEPMALSQSPVGNLSQNSSQNGRRSPSTSSCENHYPSVAAPVSSKLHDRTPLLDYSRALNGNSVTNMSLYRPSFGQPFQRPGLFPNVISSVSAISPGAPPPPINPMPAFTHSQTSSSPIPGVNDGGPTDLSMKTKPLLAHKLNASEISTVRQLITGYRESAAFLLRSADELEQLLIQQQ